MKRKILIASFLKPVNDIRSYQKIAKSLSQNQTYKIYCLGYPSNIEVSDKNVQLLPLRSFKKNGLGRIIGRWEVFKTYLKLKPELIIVNSPDLLLLTCVYRIIFGGKIVYDIRENYFKNLWYQHNYIWGIKHVFAIIIRAIELVTSPLFNHFFLAEKIYTKQLNFTNGKSTILENKSLQTINLVSQLIDFDSPKFIISGTIAIEYGIFEGINFYENLRLKFPNSILTIIGKCASVKLRKELELRAKKSPSITLNISENSMEHDCIEAAILSANFGLLPYLPNESIIGKWPTKLYEYMGYQLPIIIQKNMGWDNFISTHNAGVSFDFIKQNPASIKTCFESIKTKSLYLEKSIPEVFWDSEEVKLLSLVNSCFND